MKFILFDKSRNKYYKGIVQKTYPSYYTRKEYCKNMKDAYVYSSYDMINLVANWNDNIAIYCIDNNKWIESEVEWNRIYKLSQL